MRTRDKIAIFRLIPPKLAVAILGVLILYALLQPLANWSFGWSLPSLVSILNLDFGGNQKTTKTTATKEHPQTKKSSKKADVDSASKDSATSDVPHITLNAPDQSKSTSQKNSTTAKNSKTKSATSDQTSIDQSDLKFGLLKSVGRDRYQSPAGLTYGPGGEEGHRLKHLERHLVDQPDRPGPHGVFDGDMSAFLTAIDDAYTRASEGAKGTTRHDEDDSIVYEASFPKPIGHLSGTDGAAKKHPKLKHMRVVVSTRNKNVITAFPF